MSKNSVGTMQFTIASLCFAAGLSCSSTLLEKEPAEETEPAALSEIPLGVTVVALRSHLPPCVWGRRGMVFYVESTEELRYCDGRHYQLLDLVLGSGQDGISWIVFTEEVSSDPCENGGVLISSGPDFNGNGQLDSDEVVSSTALCNGIDGADGEDGAPGKDGVDGIDGADGTPGTDGVDGTNALVEVQPEPEGDNCPAGGFAVVTGLDADGDEALSDDEVNQISYVCHGEQGPPGGDGTDDTTPPVTAVLPTQPGFRDSVQVSLLCSDTGGSGCETTYFTLDGSAPTTGSFQYLNPIALTESTLIRVMSVDHAGNQESPHEVQFVHDNTAPTTTADPPATPFGGSIEITLTCDDQGGIGCDATYYTLDGSAPSSDSTLYTEPFTVSDTTTVRFFSTDAAGNVEAVQQALYTVDTTPPVSDVYPAPGVFDAPISVEITCEDLGGVGCEAIFYSLYPADPEEAFLEYAAPVLISGVETLRFFAVDAAGNEEAVQSAQYVVDSEAPVSQADPLGGWIMIDYNNRPTISISCDDGIGSGCAAIHYTMDGSLPTTDSPVFTDPIDLYAYWTTDYAESMTLRFFSIDQTGNQEAVHTELYELDWTTPYVYIYGATLFVDSTTVEISCTDSQSGCRTVYYTVDGTNPTTDSPQYTEPFTLAESAYVRAIAVDNAGWISSVRTQQFIKDDTPPTVSHVTPEDGAVFASPMPQVTVELSEYIEDSTLTEASFYIEGVPATVRFSYPRTGYLVLDEPLEADTTYTVHVTTDVTDPAGNPLAEEAVWSFTTRPLPDVLLGGGLAQPSVSDLAFDGTGDCILSVTSRTGTGYLGYYQYYSSSTDTWSDTVHTGGTAAAVAGSESGFLLAEESDTGLLVQHIQGNVVTEQFDIATDYPYAVTASDGEGYALAWAEASDQPVQIRIFQDGAWGDDAAIPNSTGSDLFHDDMSITGNGGQYAAVWMSGGAWLSYFNGIAWSAPVFIIPRSGYSDPNVMVSPMGNDFILLWEQSSSDEDALEAALLSGGTLNTLGSVASNVTTLYDVQATADGVRAVYSGLVSGWSELMTRDYSDGNWSTPVSHFSWEDPKYNYLIGPNANHLISGYQYLDDYIFYHAAEDEFGVWSSPSTFASQPDRPQSQVAADMGVAWNTDQGDVAVWRLEQDALEALSSPPHSGDPGSAMETFSGQLGDGTIVAAYTHQTATTQHCFMRRYANGAWQEEELAAPWSCRAFAVSDDAAVVAWYDSNDRETYTRAWSSTGWHDPLALGINNPMLTSNGHYFIALTDGYGAIESSTLPPDLSGWSTPVQLTSSGDDLKVASNGSTVMAVWSSNDNLRYAEWIYSDVLGTGAWGPSYVITSGTHEEFSFEGLASDGAGYMLTWKELVQLTSTSWQTHGYSQTFDGTSWAPTVEIGSPHRGVGPIVSTTFGYFVAISGQLYDGAEWSSMGFTEMWNSEYSYFDAIVHDNGILHLYYFEGNFYTRFYDGSAWTEALELATDFEYRGMPRAASLPDSAMLLWTQPETERPAVVTIRAYDIPNALF